MLTCAGWICASTPMVNFPPACDSASVSDNLVVPEGAARGFPAGAIPHIAVRIFADVRLNEYDSSVMHVDAHIVANAPPDVVGACLDTGNPVYGGEDPVLSAEVLGPYVISTHVRDSRVWEVEDGAMAQWSPVGQGNVDLRRVVQILADQAPRAPVDLEIITGGTPKHIPYLNPEAEFWTMYPDMQIGRASCRERV